MAMTSEELADFHQYAQQQVSLGDAESLQKLVEQWTARREFDESVRSIQQSLRQHEDGQSVPVEQAFREVRSRLESP